MTTLMPLEALSPALFESPVVLKRLAAASRKLAELKGVAASFPDQEILINLLGLQEAKDSSEIEGIITTHAELFRDDGFPDVGSSPAAKEVMRYRQALWIGFDAVRNTGLLTVNHILAMQEELEQNNAGIRKLPGTALRDGAGNTVYTPPQEHDAIVQLMADLERFINDTDLFDADPLIKMALIHYQFESIHPFYDGNGRTGRIINVLYLAKEGLLDSPALYLSRYILRHKPDYYRLLQAVREQGSWEEWVLYMLAAVEDTAAEAVQAIVAIKAALLDTAGRIQAGYKFHSQALVSNLFNHPYTKIEYIERDLKVSRLTATKYLDALTAGGILRKQKVGRSNYYINTALNAILTDQAMGVSQ